MHLLTLLRSKARCSLLAPLGGYLCCGYAIKRGLRKSLFSRSYISLPEPWIEIRSLVGKPVFIDRDTAASARVDPRLRAFPIEGQDRKAEIRSSKYMKAYNASPSTCKEYWGHLGRAWTTRSRSTPTVFVLLFMGFAVFLDLKGVICIFNYHWQKKRFWVTLPQLPVVISVILGVTGAFAIVIIPLYALYSITSVLMLWSSILRKLEL